MKKSSVIVTIVCLLSFVQIYAQKQEWNADSIVNRAYRLEKSYFSVQAQVQMKTTDKKRKSTEQNGTFYWQKDRMCLSYLDTAGELSFQVIQVVDTIWIYDAELNRMEIQMSAEADLRNSGTDSEKSKELFYPARNSYANPRIKKIIGDSVAIISVYPLHPDKTSWNQMDIQIDLRTYQYIGFTTFQKNLTTITFLLKYTSINEKLDPSLFLFDPKNYPDGLEVLDHRKE
jgi:outer membrane lipoprotein-sorting protein